MNMDLGISNNVLFGAILRKQHKKENETSPRSTLNVSNQNRSSLFLPSNVVDGEPISQQMETKTWMSCLEF